MTTPKGDKKGKTKIPSTNDPESNQGNEFSDYEENSPTVLQTSSKDRTIKMDRNMAKPSYEHKVRSMEEHVFGRASDVFTFKLSIPAVVLTIALAVYIIQAKNEFETKVAVLMKYEEYLVKLSTLSKLVPIYEKGLFDLKKQLVIDNEDIGKLKQHISNTDENIKNRLTKLAEYLKISEGNILARTSQLDTDISKTEVEIGSMVDKVDEYSGKLGQFKSNVNSLITDVNKMKPIVDYAGPKVWELEIAVRNLQSQNMGEIIQNRLTKLAEDLETSDGKILKRTSQLNNDISKTEVKIGIIVGKVDEYSGKIGQFKSNVDSLSADVFKMKPIVDYAGLKVKELDIVVRNLQSQNIGLFQPINVCVAFSFILIAALFYLIHFRYDNDGTQFTEHQRTELHSTPPYMSQTLPSILDRNHRVPVLDNKVCVLSFYSETMNLHRTLVESALATSRRGNNVEIIKHLVRRHEDILSIPSARYIFVFVDFNERNVILEHPGLDMGDKKLVTVQAAQKIGADVFVTYVRDRGSTQLLPGDLYNQELSAFTRHRVLKGLANKQRCFSVYETFNNTQKESIVRSIS